MDKALGAIFGPGGIGVAWVRSVGGEAVPGGKGDRSEVGIDASILAGLFGLLVGRSRSSEQRGKILRLRHMNARVQTKRDGN